MTPQKLENDNSAPAMTSKMNETANQDETKTKKGKTDALLG